MFNINYTKVKFTILFDERCKLNKNKNSAIRGILGHSLMDCNCILYENRNCGQCMFSNTCIASILMNRKLSKNGQFLGNNGITPFIIDCENKAIEFNEFDELEFFITIFEDSIVLTPYVIYALQFAGVTRGLEGNTYNLVSVEGVNGEKIFDGNRLYKENIKILSLEKYVSDRLSKVKNINSMKLITPLRFKKNGKLSENINFEEIINLINRRMETLYKLSDKEYTAIPYKNKVIERRNIKWKEQERYSNRQKQKMSLGGLIGEISIDFVPEEYKELLIAGELIHIGKSTALGLGKYIIR